MRKLLLFNLKSLLLNRRLWILISIMVVLNLAFVESRIKQEPLQQSRNQAALSKELQRVDKAVYDLVSLYGEQTARMMPSYDAYQSYADCLRDAYKSAYYPQLFDYSQRDAQYLDLKLDLKRWELLQEGYGFVAEDAQGLNDRIEKKQLLYERDISLIDEAYHMSSWNALAIFHGSTVYFLFLSFVILIGIEFFSDYQRNDINKRLYSLPFKRKKIHQIMTLSLYVYAVLILFLMLSAYGLYCGLRVDFANADYLMAIKIASTAGYVTLPTFFVLLVVYDLLILFLICQFTSLICILSTSLLNSVLITAVIAGSMVISRVLNPHGVFVLELLLGTPFLSGRYRSAAGVGRWWWLLLPLFAFALQRLSIILIARKNIFSKAG